MLCAHSVGITIVFETEEQHREGHQVKDTTTPTKRARRWAARLGAVALVAGSFVVATGTAAFADAPDVSTTTGSVVNADPLADGYVEVEVQGTWAWPTHKNKDCNVDRWAAGWAVVWNDPKYPGALGGFEIGKGSQPKLYVGVAAGNALNAEDNSVNYYVDPPRCGVFGTHGALSYNTGNWGGAGAVKPTTYKYELPSDVDTTKELEDFVAGLRPCAVMYDVHGKGSNPEPNNPAKELKAGGEGRNGDNSYEANNQTPAGNVCAQINVVLPDPDVAVEKTASAAQVTAGENITYTIEVTNTGTVATSATVIDEIPATTIVISLDPLCEIEDEFPDTIFCQVGTLEPGQSRTVTIVVQTTVAGTVVNTAVVTPNDETPGDNVSTVTTQVLEPAAQAITVTPRFTG